MRIVGGHYRGAPLASPGGGLVRPTPDRVRESLFNILSHSLDAPDWEQTRVLDLFAGTGALGLEAVSRGAAHCLFVEQSADARGVIRQNIEQLNLTGKTRIFRRDATRLGPTGTAGQFSLVFADPPYGKSLGEKAMAEVRDGGWMPPNGLFVLEESGRSELDIPEGFTLTDERKYGDTVIYFFALSQNP